MTASDTYDEAEIEPRFVHHVFFWLADGAGEDAHERLITGLRTLSAAPSIRRYQIGVPAGGDRDVIDSSYAVSWLLFFDGDAAQAAYQTDPLHLQFIEQCATLWTRVLVYDCVLAA